MCVCVCVCVCVCFLRTRFCVYVRARTRMNVHVHVYMCESVCLTEKVLRSISRLLAQARTHTQTERESE